MTPTHDATPAKAKKLTAEQIQTIRDYVRRNASRSVYTKRAQHASVLLAHIDALAAENAKLRGVVEVPFPLSRDHKTGEIECLWCGARGGKITVEGVKHRMDSCQREIDARAALVAARLAGGGEDEKG